LNVPAILYVATNYLSPGAVSGFFPVNGAGGNAPRLPAGSAAAAGAEAAGFGFAGPSGTFYALKAVNPDPKVINLNPQCIHPGPLGPERSAIFKKERPHEKKNRSSVDLRAVYGLFQPVIGMDRY
jgi:hypothetical protein